MNINIQCKTLISKIDKLFNANRPECIVDNPKCCLDCEEAYEKHKNLKQLKNMQADDFNVIGISLGILNDSGFWYYFPKSIELVLKGKEITHGVYEGYLLEIVLNILESCKNKRFKNIGKNQKDFIVSFLEFISEKYYKDAYNYWDYDEEKIIYDYESENIFNICTNALKCWRPKV